MKTIIFLILFSLLYVISYAQPMDSVIHPMHKADYLNKSRNQKTIAWVFLGVGAALDLGGIATTISNANKEVGNLLVGTSVNHGAEIALYVGGTASLLTSLGLFISAKANKKKGSSLSVDVQQYRQFKAGNMYSANYPALTLKIPL